MNLEQIGSNWIKFDPIGRINCIKLDQTWSNWIKLIKLDQIGMRWIKLVHIGSYWFKLVQIGSNWFKLVLIGSNWFKLVQTCSKISTLQTNRLYWRALTLKFVGGDVVAESRLLQLLFSSVFQFSSVLHLTCECEV